LEALLGRPIDATEGGLETDLGTSQDTPHSGGIAIGVYEIERNPFQPRQEFDEAEISSLAESIKQHGLLQPLVVRRVAGRYQLIAGERRLRAATKAGWTEVPVLIREADDRQVAEIAIVENLQRKDLNALEKAASFRDYLERYRCTQEELAVRLAMDRSTIANLIRLLELPAEIQAMLRSGNLTQGHARALLPLGGEREQIEFARRIERDRLSVRATEELVQEAIQAADAESEPLTVVASDARSRPAKKRTRSQQIASLEQELRIALGTKVEIRTGAKGKGKILVHFANPDEYERLHEQLTARPGKRSQTA
jgi:ParB family chromosome partitioning protein